MIEQIKMVEAFHDAFGIKMETSPTAGGLYLEQRRELAEKRFKFLEEENLEYFQAVEEGDVVGILDALVDQLYFVFGTATLHGVQHLLVPAFEEVQRSNMSKLGADGKPIINDGILNPDVPVGKVLKGPNYSKPNLKQFFGV